MHDKFQVAVSEEIAEAKVLRLTGQLDAEGAQTLKATVQSILDDGHRFVVLEMSEIRFVASSGIGTLLMLADMFRRAKATIVIAAPSTPVTSVIELLNLSSFLEISDSVEAALQTGVTG